MASTTGDGPIELQQTVKRDALKAIERQSQERWRNEKLFEVDAPPITEHEHLTPAQIREKYPKWFGNFPFPYMNGSLHLGHAFTFSKIEFAAGYQRMLGKRVLFPHGFHVTGMPIRASADKIIREMEMFGPDFENYTETESEDSPVPPAHVKQAPPDKAVDKGKKGKIAAKATGHTYQFQIMESIGVPRREIKKFADATYWLYYFPPIAIADHNSFGSRIDWRRSFMTTDINPYFDSFVRWQMNKLHALDKVKFGERYTIYSPKDGQPCMDHDRQDGEGVGPQEYTGIKMEVVAISAAAEELVDKIGKRKLFLVAATLRPETMYGQTNCFVGTEIKYGLYPAKNNEVFVCTHRAARNMAFQGITEVPGEAVPLAEIKGSALIGTKVKAPLAIHGEVYVLPMDGVLATKGTGVVTSVPSDSPDDFATYTDLRRKPEFYKVDPQWLSLDPIPVLSTPAYGEMSAPTLIAQLKINSQRDIKQLATAKELAYKEGFYSGIMSVGEFKGQTVQDAKGKVRAKLIAEGLAFAYAEPEGFVLSRSADECVVALMDQWYLDYGESSWREQAEKLLARMNTYNTETRNAFEGVLGWLNKWACARTYGLGSKLPWDPKFLVESLSDSTIYMSYYTVAHFLQGGSADGSVIGPLGIKAEEMTDPVWDYVFGHGPWPSDSSIPKEKADIMKHEFNYFYPMDVRSSGKDLIPNHLTFAIYNHAALFPEQQWPLSMRANGHLMLNGKKMSKSTGNSLTLRESIEKFGADATRLCLADAGDGIEDANFDEKNANANILRLHTLIDWCQEMIKQESSLRHGPHNSYHDTVFEQEINDLINTTRGHYEAMHYKDALKFGFYDFQSTRDWYREVTSDIGMHAELIKKWIRSAVLLITPIAPHFAEHVWTNILGEKTSVQLALWPTPTTPVKRAVLESGAYMREIVKTIRESESSMLKKMSKSKATPFDPKKPKSVRIYVAHNFPEWQDRCVNVVKDAYDSDRDKVDDQKIRKLLTEQGLMKDKRAMPFVQAFKKRMTDFGAQAAFNRSLVFSEYDVLTDFIPYLKKTLNLVDVEVLLVEDARKKEGAGFTSAIIESGEPGSPAIEFRNV